MSETTRGEDFMLLWAVANGFLEDELAELGLQEAEASEVLEAYRHPNAENGRVNTLPELWRAMLNSAINRQMSSKVIRWETLDEISGLLFDYDVETFLASLAGDPSRRHLALLDAVIQEVASDRKIRATRRSLWPAFCKTIISSAEFLSQFSSAAEFYRWADGLSRDPKTRAGLPLIIAAEVHGFGYVLACDFLKEIGYVEFGKPDVHIKRILVDTGTAGDHLSEYQLQKVLRDIADAVETTPYHVDKILWLIGSGYFYRHPHLGKDGETGGKRAKFLAEFPRRRAALKAGLEAKWGTSAPVEVMKVMSQAIQTGKLSITR